MDKAKPKQTPDIEKKRPMTKQDNTKQKHKVTQSLNFESLSAFQQAKNSPNKKPLINAHTSQKILYNNNKESDTKFFMKTQSNLFEIKKISNGSNRNYLATSQINAKTGDLVRGRDSNMMMMFENKDNKHFKTPIIRTQSTLFNQNKNTTNLQFIKKKKEGSHGSETDFDKNRTFSPSLANMGDKEKVLPKSQSNFTLHNNSATMKKINDSRNSPTSFNAGAMSDDKAMKNYYIKENIMSKFNKKEGSTLSPTKNEDSSINEGDMSKKLKDFMYVPGSNKKGSGIKPMNIFNPREYKNTHGLTSYKKSYTMKKMEDMVNE